MTQSKLILIGAGGHSHSCIDIIERLKKFKIVGLIGLPHELNEIHLRYNVIGIDTDLGNLIKVYKNAFITLGHIKSAERRIALYGLVKKLGFKLPTLVSTAAYVSPHAVIGEGSIVMPGAVINAGAIIGRNCIINSNALVEHDVEILDHCHISTGSVINGSVKIGSGCFIGSGSIIREAITIGDESFLAMGSMIYENVDAKSYIRDKQV